MSTTVAHKTKDIPVGAVYRHLSEFEGYCLRQILDSRLVGTRFIAKEF